MKAFFGPKDNGVPERPDISNGKRYVEVVGGIGVCRLDLNEGEPISVYNGHGREVLYILGKFTRENVESLINGSIGPELRPIEDFHAVCDDMEIPWATKEGFDTYQHVMKLAAAKQHKEDEQK